MAIPPLVAAIAGIGGGKAGLLEFDNDSAFVTSTVLSTSNCWIQFETNGTGTYFAPAAGSFVSWYIPSPSTGAGTGVYVRANTNTGSFTHPSSEAADTWVELTSARMFGQQRTTDGSDDWNGEFEYSFDGGSNIVFTTGNFSITAIYSSS